MKNGGIRGGQKGACQGDLFDASETQEKAWQGTCNPCHSLTCETFTPPMVDTVSLVCPVDASVLEVLSARSGTRMLLTGDGEIERSTPRIGSLPGSYDPNLWVQPWTLDGKPALRLEGSAHRHILGHNITGGPTSPYEASVYMIRVLEAYLGVKLPPTASWRYLRIDLAYVFDLGTEDAAFSFMTEASRSVVSSTAARSAPRTFGTTVYMGRVKLYMKGPEVRTNIPKWCDKKRHMELIKQAGPKLRFEVTFHRRDIERLTINTLEQADMEPLVVQFYGKLNTFARTTKDAMEQVRTTTAVQQRLAEMYAPQRASALMGTWFRLTTLGERETRASMSRPTYYRHMAELKNAGVSWTGTDVVRIQKLAFPSDFSLSPMSPYLDRSGVHPQIQRALSLAS